MTAVRRSSQDCSNFTTNGTSSTATYPATATANELLVAVGLLSTVAANVTRPTGSTDLFAVDLSTSFCLIAVAKIAAGTETGMTFSMGGQPNGDVYVAAFQYSGAANPLAIDKTATNTSGSQVATLATGTTATTTQADELVISAVALGSTGTSPSSANGDDNTVATNLIRNVNSRLFVAQRRVAATGAYSDTFNWTNINFPAAGIATIKADITARPYVGMY